MDTLSSSKTISFTVTHRGVTHHFSQPFDCSLVDFQAQLEELFGVPPSLQKLLYKGKKTTSDDITLAQAGFKNGVKIQMLGTTTQELDGMKLVEDEQRRRERILRERASKTPVKLRSTGTGGRMISTLSSPATPASSPYRFHEIKPLEHLPNPSTAREFLTRLSDDLAIQHVMRKHEFSVGELTELAPHENPELLGLNVNKGQQIKLRIRTDRYDGFRLYQDVRRVLCHELAHNIWGDHDNNFKELNSKLNREVAEFERLAVEGTHTLSGSFPGDVYMPPSEVGADTGYVLGKDSEPSGSTVDESMEERRRKVLEATMNRLRKEEEEELEHCCGTGQG